MMTRVRTRSMAAFSGDYRDTHRGGHQRKMRFSVRTDAK
jgi:hypothetical protein